MSFEEMLLQNQAMISETTGLLKQLHQVSLRIAEAHEEQIRELKVAHLELKQAQLDFAIDTREAFLKLMEAQAKQTEAQAKTEAGLDRLERLIESFIRGNRGNGRSRKE
jgi:hypothetical protein